MAPLYPERQVLADGSKQQALRVEGRIMQPFLLKDYPLDRQKLAIMIEDIIHTIQQLAYLADTDATGISALLIRTQLLDVQTAPTGS